MVNTEKLISRYIEASIKYGKAQEEGDAKKVNKCANIIRKIRTELKKDSPIYVEKLEPLLVHENDYVRLKTAFDLLPILTEQAEEVLVELSNKKGLIGFEAEMTLEEWKRGNLIY